MYEPSDCMDEGYFFLYEIDENGIDDESINADVEQLISDTGFDPVRVGGIDQSIRIEVFGDLHKFGALGKTVTASEANSKI